MIDIKQNWINLKDLTKIQEYQPQDILFTPDIIPWLNEQKINSQRSILEKMYCTATTNTTTLAWSGNINRNSFDTNTPLMGNTNWQITIIKDWTYLIISQVDLARWGGTVQNRIDVNSTVVAYDYHSIYYATATDRYIKNISRVFRCKAWDTIKVFPSVLYTSGNCFLQVQEL